MLDAGRMPANALIDFLLPTLEGGNWLDLANADAVAAEGASVWIADMLSISENGAGLPKPQLLAVRLSRTNDPSFATFQDALNRVKGAPLPATRSRSRRSAAMRCRGLRSSMHSRFSFEPRSLASAGRIPRSPSDINGGHSKFQYRTIPEHCAGPGLGHAVAIASETASLTTHETDYLLMTAVSRLVFKPFAGAASLWHWSRLIVALLGHLKWGPAPRIRGLLAS